MEKYNETAARLAASAYGETDFSAVGTDSSDRSDRNVSSSVVSVGVGTGLHESFNHPKSLGKFQIGCVGKGPFGPGQMKPLTSEQAAKVKSALTGRRLHFYDCMHGGSGVKLVKSGTDLTLRSRNNSSSSRIESGLQLLFITRLLMHSYVQYSISANFHRNFLF